MTHEETIQACTDHLQAISRALDAYESDHKELPPRLADLYPQYLSERDVLRCPGDTTPAKPDADAVAQEPLPDSYAYEMSTEKAPEGGAILGPTRPGPEATWRERKQAQQVHFGERVPVVRCRHHAGTVLNLTRKGQVYRSSWSWESQPETLAEMLACLARDLAAGPEALLQNWSMPSLEEFVHSWILGPLPPALRAQLGSLASALTVKADTFPEAARYDVLSLAARFYAAGGRKQEALAACHAVLKFPGENAYIDFLFKRLAGSETGRVTGRSLVDAYLRAERAVRHIPGVSVAVVRKGKIVLAKGYGLANVELAVPATESSVYQMASVTKQFTATAIMMLVEEGNLTLDATIAAVLPDLPAAWGEVTVRQLLTHTSGIKSYTSVPDLEQQWRLDYSRDQILQRVAEAPADFAPGEKMLYNNTGYYLLGLMIEKGSGRSYAEFLNERIFQPLGMAATRVNDLTDIVSQRATGYAWTNGQLRNAVSCSPSWPYAAGALLSTVTDMAKWDAAVGTERLLTQESWQEMWKPTRLNDGSTTPYGFGWGIGTYRGHGCIEHGGGIPGFSTYTLRFPAAQLTVVLLTNRGGVDTGALARGIAAFYLPAAKPLRISEAERKAQPFDIVSALLHGTAEKERFTDVAYARLSPELKRVREFYEALGPLKSSDLIEKAEGAQETTYRYRMQFREATWIQSLATTLEGKITQILIEPE
jgi:D-alanyl-D-alanine carboxypeptidase